MDPPHPNRPSNERPAWKLTVDLLGTYKHINELFYEAKRRKQALDKSTGEKKGIYNDGYDDDSGNYIVQIGEEIAGRYIVQDLLGKGSFGVVVKAHDHRRDECVGIKIIKNKVQFFQQAKVEIDILTKLNAAASEEHNIVKLKKVFQWKEHLCLVFELLSFNLYDLLKYTKFNGVSLNLIRKFACQILKTLDFLCSQPIKILHCDLKPENILLKNPRRSGVKVIDFGSSCYLHKKMFKYIQSRFYRSPEVIWGLNYDCAIDMWSLACILVEMHTGLPLFDGKDEAEQLLKFHHIIGPPANALIEVSPKRTKFYTFNAATKTWILNQCKGVVPTPKSSLEQVIGVYTHGPQGRRKGQQGHTEQDYLNFLDLIQKMLTYNPKLRITPSIALQHPFLTLPEDSAGAQNVITGPAESASHGPEAPLTPKQTTQSQAAPLSTQGDQTVQPTDSTAGAQTNGGQPNSTITPTPSVAETSKAAQPAPTPASTSGPNAGAAPMARESDKNNSVLPMTPSKLNQYYRSSPSHQQQRQTAPDC